MRKVAIFAVTRFGSTRSHYKKITIPSLTAQRSFASGHDDLKKMLDNLKNRREEDSETTIPKEASSAAESGTEEEKEKEVKEKGAQDQEAPGEKEETVEGGDSKKEGEQQSSSSSSMKFEPPSPAKVMEMARSSYAFVVENTLLAYDEMMGHTKESLLTKKVHQAESFRPAKKKKVEGDGEEEEEEEEEKYAGTQALVFVAEPRSAWESMKDRLQDSPFIKEILKSSKKAQQQAAATDLGKKATEASTAVKDKLEDAREFWETSQNPLVYTVSGIWDNMTSETEEGICTAEIRKLDPSFSKEEWAQEVKVELAPMIIKAHLAGNTSALKPWLGEGE